MTGAGLVDSARAKLLLPAAVFLLAGAQYANTLSHDYAWDDKLVITANEYTTQGAAGLVEIFTQRVSIPYKSVYRPVPQALHAIEYELFGANPHTGHLFNVLWYAATCVLVYAFVGFVFPGLNRLFQFLVAALFLVHPLHVEVVANIKGRDEILALFFGLGSVILLVVALERLSWPYLTAGAVCFTAACLSKTNAVTLLPLVGLVFWYRSPGVRISRRLVLAGAAIAVVSIALVFLIRESQTTVSEDVPLHLQSTVLNNIFLWSTRSEAVVPTAVVIVARYAILFAYPHPLVHMYGYNQISLSGWGSPEVWLVALGLVLVGVAVFRTLGNRRPFAFAVIWFAVTYSVYSHLFFFAPDTMADRYMFFPSIGLAILMVQGFFALASLDAQEPLELGARAKTVFCVGVALLAAYSVRTAAANRDWRDDDTLIHSRIRYMENNAAAQAVYGYTVLRESYGLAPGPARRARQTEAMDAFTRAITIYPDFQAAWIEIGKLFAEHEIYDKAELAFLKAQRLETLNPDPYFYLGALYLAQQNPDLAIPYLEKAVLLSPKMEEAYVMLGKAYLQADTIENLGALATTARGWFPESVDLLSLTATYHFRIKEYGRAYELAQEVLTAQPDNILALSILSSPLVNE